MSNSIGTGLQWLTSHTIGGFENLLAKISIRSLVYRQNDGNLSLRNIDTVILKNTQTTSVAKSIFKIMVQFYKEIPCSY